MKNDNTNTTAEVTYEEILEKVTETFGEFFIGTCTEKGWALNFSEDFSESLFIMSTEKENFNLKKEIAKTFSEKINYDNFYVKQDFDSISEIDFDRENVMLKNGDLFSFPGDDFHEQNIEYFVEKFGKDFAIEYVEKNLLPISQKYIEDAQEWFKEKKSSEFAYMIENCVEWFFVQVPGRALTLVCDDAPEGIVHTTKEDVFEEVFTYFGEKDYEVESSDVYKYMGKKYIVA